MLLALALLLVHRTAPPPRQLGGPCRTAADCSHLGSCDAVSSDDKSGDGRCRCGVGWTGEHCEQLDLQPLGQLSGLQSLLRRNATSSWGGAAVSVGQGASLRYHMVRGGEREMLLPPRDPPPASASVTNSWARVGL